MGWALLGAVVLLGGAIGFYVRYFPVMATSGWKVGVWAQDIPRVSALAHHPEGGLYATQEKLSPKGTLLYVQKGGGTHLLLDGLTKPDGLALFRGGVVVSQEGGIAPVVWYNNGQILHLFSANKAESIISGDGDRYLYVVEDRQGGRLLRYDAVTMRVEELITDGSALEGIALCPNGSLYVSSKQKGEVYKYLGKNQLETVLSGLNKASFLLCNKSGLWITEDATAHARVLLYNNGELQTIARHLRSAQTILEDGPGRMLVAEQGRNRILVLTQDEGE